MRYGLPGERSMSATGIATGLHRADSLDILGLQGFNVVVELCCIPTARLVSPQGRVNFALVLNACEVFSTGGGNSEAEDHRSASGMSG